MREDNDKLKHLREWQEIVGSCVIGAGLSYQCEIEQVVTDTYNEGYSSGKSDALKEIKLELALNPKSFITILSKVEDTAVGDKTND